MVTINADQKETRLHTWKMRNTGIFPDFPLIFGVFFDGIKMAMKLTKGYRSENNPLLNNNSIPYEEFQICGIHS